MARKSSPQPLTLGSTNFVDENDLNFIDGSKSPLSPKSPKSPRHPFKFTTKKQRSPVEQPPMQAAEPPQTRGDLPQSQTLPALYQYSAAPGGEENNKERERPARSGFFANYKASKSSSRLQPTDNKAITEDSMSRDTDRPAMSGKVSSQDTTRNGTTILFRSSSSDDRH